MTAEQIRKKFLEFFKKKGHKVLPSSSLVPEHDPTVLFTTAGMQPLVPYLLGEPHPLGRRLCNIQKCLRTDDIDKVGDSSHLTFFEMLGNWSLGDYFKKETIEWSFEFLTKELNIPLEKLAISVFEGEPENNIPRDEESAEIWQKLGMPKERIVYLGREDNWWGPAGKTGPCGPDTEVFYWTGKSPVPKKLEPTDKGWDEHWFEVWNDVFMEYEKTEEGKFVPLKQKNVDTGMGLERMLAVLEGKENVFETELFLPVIEEIRRLASKKDERAERIIADHLKSTVFLISEGILPSNIERGYVLRRLLRRAIRYAKLLNLKEKWYLDLIKKVIGIYQDTYPEVRTKETDIITVWQKEEECFAKALDKGLTRLEKILKSKKEKIITGKEAFDIYQSYGFPLELTEELVKEKDFEVDKEGFYQAQKEHQEISRRGAEKKFGGLHPPTTHEDKYQMAKLHTATHLLHQALRQVLGKKVHPVKSSKAGASPKAKQFNRVKQMGSDIRPERLRFDFSFERKMTDEEIKKVEDLVNQKIKQDLEVKKEEMEYEKALKSGALSFFKEKYPERVTVYSIDNFSKEICAGPHVKTTSELGKFKITKEESSAAGIRRLRAILE